MGGAWGVGGGGRGTYGYDVVGLHEPGLRTGEEAEHADDEGAEREQQREDGGGTHLV